MDLVEDLAAILGLKVDLSQGQRQGGYRDRILHEVVSFRSAKSLSALGQYIYLNLFLQQSLHLVSEDEVTSRNYSILTIILPC